jgi:hypothetical protein
MNATDRLQLEKQLRDARKAEVEQRKIAHKLEVRRNRSGNKNPTARGAAPRAMPLDLLAIGDSWLHWNSLSKCPLSAKSCREQMQQIAIYSITSSARTRNVSGIVKQVPWRL